MNTHTYHPASRLQQVMQLSLTRLIAGSFLVFIPVAIWQTLVMSLPISSILRSILVAGVSVPAACGGYYVLVHFIERRDMTELSPSGAAGETVRGVLIGAVFYGGIMLLLALLGAYKIVGMNSSSVLLAPLIFMVSSAVFEEILFRGVLFRLIERSLGSWLALAISGALWGVLHLMNKNATFTGALAIMLQAGIAMGAAFMLTRRLWLPIGIHFGWNFVQSGIFGSAVSGNEAEQGLLNGVLTGPDWLTGGVFGVEASLVTVVIALVVGVLFLWRAHRRGNIIPRKRFRREHVSVTVT